jgi:hypothetical protein
MNFLIWLSNSRRDVAPHSRGMFCPSLAGMDPQSIEGAGKAGCSKRTRGLASEKIKDTSVVTTGPPKQSGFPCAIGFNGFLRALSGDRAFLPPSLADCSANLMPASRHQDHATSPSAWRRSSGDAPRPSHPAPNVRDDRETPLLIGHGTREELSVICPTAQVEISSMEARRLVVS